MPLIAFVKNGFHSLSLSFWSCEGQRLAMILQISLQRPMTAFVKELAICCQIIMTTVKFDGKKLPNELCNSFYCKGGVREESMLSKSICAHNHAATGSNPQQDIYTFLNSNS